MRRRKDGRGATLAQAVGPPILQSNQIMASHRLTQFASHVARGKAAIGGYLEAAGITGASVHTLRHTMAPPRLAGFLPEPLDHPHANEGVGPIPFPFA